ncbi:MAG: sugar phosphate isomerase/epimerase family protein [Candidatus Omnitrophota bacterium]
MAYAYFQAIFYFTAKESIKYFPNPKGFDMKITKEKVYFHAPYRILLKRLNDISGMRVNCEIYVDGEALDSHKDDETDKVNLVFEKFGISKIVHGPFLDLNPGSKDSRIRQVSRQRFISALEFCEKLKVSHIVLHSGFNPIFYKDASAIFLDLSFSFWREILRIAIEKKIVIAIENSIDPTPEIIVGLLKEFNSPNLEACFDAGHYNAFGAKSILESLEEYPPRSIGELHLSDNKGYFDDHLALGEGNIDYAEIFKKIKEMSREPILTSEPHCFEDIEKNLKYLTTLSF